jgi:hypothetical protein
MAELAVATDAQDTDFTVKLIDVYPNGYEALVLDQAFRLRYVNGFDKPAKPEPGKVYPIQVDLWSTALIFNTGHKIAIHVSSSNSPRFEPHSNTWEPVKSYDQAIKANNTVFLDGRSRLGSACDEVGVEGFHWRGRALAPHGPIELSVPLKYHLGFAKSFVRPSPCRWRFGLCSRDPAWRRAPLLRPTPIHR